MIDASPDIRAIVQQRGLRYELVNDYGKGSTLVATVVDGAVRWSDHLALGSFLTRPDSGDVVVEPTTYRGSVPGSPGTLQPYTTPIIVRAAGTTLQLPEVRPLGD